MALHETPHMNMDDNVQIENILKTNFELAEPNLDGTQTAQFLTRAINELPVDGMKVIALIGGPASGKSTLVKEVIHELEKAGSEADSISTDDYGLGTRAWRWEREREDPLMLKDFKLLNKNIDAIKQIHDDDEQVAVPTYDEATGLAIEAGPENFTHKVGKLDALIVEGDFDAVENPDLVIFIDVPAENRLQTRIARDLEKRGEVDAEKVANSFRSRHEKQFIPYTAPTINKANVVLKVNPIQGDWQYDVYRARQVD